jgi:hypothetical protein
VECITHRVGRKYLGAYVIAVVLSAGALLPGCETSSTISQGPNPVKCRVTLAAPPPLDAAGGAGSLAVTAPPECAWDAATNAGWISALSPASGQGSGTVSFRVAANDSASPRDDVIVVNDEQARVSQRAPCRFEISPMSYGTGASGGSSTLSITTPTDCVWTAAADVSWITVASPAAGSGNGSVGFAVAPSREDVRRGSIVVANERMVVTQASGVPPPPPPPPPPPQPPPPPPPVCMYSLSRTSDFVAFNEGGGSVTVYTTSTCRWTVVSNAAWLLIASATSGTGNGGIDYRYATNPGPLRVGTLTISGLTFTVTQPAAP